jgi:LmbE family N-acetylglucosaminyl deacetylase
VSGVNRTRRALKHARALWRHASRSRGLARRPGGAQTLVVVAPHPDDETLGCGGLIALRRAAGCEVRVVLLSAGESSLRDWGLGGREVGAVRREQARRACACLGVPADRVTVLDHPDGRLPVRGAPAFDTAADGLAELLARAEASAVCCTHPLDGLADHAAAAEIVRAAVARLAVPPPLHFYLVWAWYNAPWGMPGFEWRHAYRVDVRAVRRAKQAAIDVYLKSASSPAGVPYCGALPRSLAAIARRPSEVFFAGGRP